MYRERERGGSGPKAVFRDEGPGLGGRHVASNLSPSFSLFPSLSSNPRQFFETKDLDPIGVISYWGTFVFFIFFSVAIAVDRSRCVFV